MNKILKRVLIAITIFISILVFFFIPEKAETWGFYTHKLINRHAVFTLPPGMIGFYKNHLEYITEHAIDPDRRSHGVPGEAERHYCDIDYYGPSPFDSVPKTWKAAVAKYTEDTLRANGILPWNIEKFTLNLTQAFRDMDADKILYYSANIGHYIADATVPLHNTQYYNGKTPQQKGIHAFWESRIPEMLAKDYTFFVGRAEYIKDPLGRAWELMKQSHYEIDTIFAIEEYLRNNFPNDKKFVIQERGATIQKQYSREYTLEFDKLSHYMVKRKINIAIFNVGSYWYTAWVNAGQPDLKSIEDKQISKAHKKELKEIDKMWKTGKPIGRPNPVESEK